MIWWFKFSLLIFVTVSVTALILWLRSWILQNKEKYPEVYKNRGWLYFAIWLTLNTGDIPR